MAIGEKLRSCRLELQSRLGFGSTDNPAISPILISFIVEAEKQLYAIGRFKHLQDFWDVTAPTGSAIVAYPTHVTKGDANPDKISEIRCNIGTVSCESWAEVKEGIRASDYNSAVSAYPCRYERRSSGLELAPIRDIDYTVRIWATRKLRSLSQDSDVINLDWDLVFPVALASAKSHYRHPDSQLYLSKSQSILNGVKWDNSKKIFSPPGRDCEAEPKPQVV